MNAPASLLPPVVTGLETALEQVGAARYPLPAALVSDVWDPAKCPAHLLGYLAWSLSLDLWDDSWPETKKRSVCRRAFDLHRLKCTPAGIREHVALTGASVLKITRPPANAHLQRAMTPEQREAWLADLPQVRIYPYFKRATRRALHGFLSAPGRRQFHGEMPPPAALEILDEPNLPIGGQSGAIVNLDGRTHLLRSRGFDLYTRRATYFDRGVETPAVIARDADGVTTRVTIRRTRRDRGFHGTGYLAGHLLQTDVENALLAVRLDQAAPQMAVVADAKPVDVRPRRIAQRRYAPAALSFFGRHGGHLSRSHAPLLIYDAVALAIPGRMGERLRVSAFHGHGRFGLAPYSAELKIKVPMRRPVRARARFHGDGFRLRADLTPLLRPLEAVRVSKALRDKVLVGTATRRPVAFDSSLAFGEFNFGQLGRVL